MKVRAQNAAISWDLVTPVSYEADASLEFTLIFTAPAEATYYILGGLFDSNGVLVMGNFGLLLPEGADEAVNDVDYTTLWELEEDEEVEQDCKFILDRTNVTLKLLLMEMDGTEPNLDNDTEIGSISVSLVGAQPPSGINMDSIMNLMLVMVVMVMMMKMVGGVAAGTTTK